MKKVLRVRQFENERSFSIELTDDLALLFKMHGNRANVIQLQANKPVSIFRNHLKADFEINPLTLDRQIDWSRAAFNANINRLRELYFTLGVPVWSYLETAGFSSMSADDKWTKFLEIIRVLDHPEYYYILKGKTNIEFSLLPGSEILQQIGEPIDAITRFYSEYVTDQARSHERTAVLKELHTALLAAELFVEKTRKRLSEVDPGPPFRQWADLIMAHLHEIHLGMDKVMLADFYNDGKPVLIPLKRDINAQHNAEVLYRKARNRNLEVKRLRDAIDEKVKVIESTSNQIAAINNNPHTHPIKLVQKIGQRGRKASEEGLPYRSFEYHGFEIRVGRNAAANDELTQRYAHKDDLWLHVKNAAGSHVVVRHRSDKKFPKEVIERAAEVAAWHSRRRGETLCAVAVTQKKFVRKPKGSAPGSVIIDREETVLVTPKE